MTCLNKLQVWSHIAWITLQLEAVKFEANLFFKSLAMNLEVLLTFLLNVWDVVSYPFYWLIQRPDLVLKRREQTFSEIQKVGSNRIKIINNSNSRSKVYEFVSRPDFDGTITSLFDFIVRTHQSKMCMGSRKILGTQKGQFGGKEVVKVSKADKFDRISYLEAADRHHNIARGLMKRLDLKKGDKVVIYANTRMEWMLTALGCIRAGATVVTLYTTMTDEAVLHGLKQTEPKIIVTEKELLNRLIKNVLPQVSRIEDTPLITLDNDAGLHARVTLLQDIEEAGQDGLQLPYPEISGEDNALLMYTSGTTANPKESKPSAGRNFTGSNIYCYYYVVIKLGPLSLLKPASKGQLFAPNIFFHKVLNIGEQALWS